jgi:hypothetical protein
VSGKRKTGANRFVSAPANLWRKKSRNHVCGDLVFEKTTNNGFSTNAISWDYLRENRFSIYGDLDKFNPNLKRFQIINLRRNYLKKITCLWRRTVSCFATVNGEAKRGYSLQIVSPMIYFLKSFQV